MVNSNDDVKTPVSEENTKKKGFLYRLFGRRSNPNKSPVVITSGQDSKEDEDRHKLATAEASKNEENNNAGIPVQTNPKQKKQKQKQRQHQVTKKSTKGEEARKRAEELKTRIDGGKQEGRIHIRMENDQVGFGYGRLFVPFLDDDGKVTTHIEVDDAYICMPHQLINFVRFCELVAQNATGLKNITLTTRNNSKENLKTQVERQEAFQALKTSLSVDYGVYLSVYYSDTLHDREIRFNNGWVVKIGRGLDYFKRVPKYALGSYDMDLRPCHQTTVDIFYRAPAARV